MLEKSLKVLEFHFAVSVRTLLINLFFINLFYFWKFTDDLNQLVFLGSTPSRGRKESMRIVVVIFQQ